MKEPPAIEVLRDAPEDVHVTPTFGREHLVTVACWCKPGRDWKDERIVIHRVMS